MDPSGSGERGERGEGPSGNQLARLLAVGSATKFPVRVAAPLEPTDGAGRRPMIAAARAQRGWD
jgi:hypothetical protein